MSLSSAINYVLVPARYFQLSANTAATQIFTGSGILWGIYGITVGTSWVITVYDNTAQSGNLLLSFTNAANTFFGPAGPNFPNGVQFAVGLNIAASGTAGVLNVLYQPSV